MILYVKHKQHVSAISLQIFLTALTQVRSEIIQRYIYIKKKKHGRAFQKLGGRASRFGALENVNYYYFPDQNSADFSTLLVPVP